MVIDSVAVSFHFLESHSEMQPRLPFQCQSALIKGNLNVIYCASGNAARIHRAVEAWTQSEGFRCGKIVWVRAFKLNELSWEIELTVFRPFGRIIMAIPLLPYIYQPVRSSHVDIRASLQR